MNLETYFIYALAILVLTASPGPSVLLCVSTSVMHGFRASAATAIGSLTAIIGIMTLSFTGLGVLIASSELAFNVIKWVGAAYLIYLGVRTFFAEPADLRVSSEEPAVRSWSPMILFARGFLVGATNPKAIVFFSALFPQFIDMEQALLPQYFLMVTTFAVMELGWLLLYGYFGAKSSLWLMSRQRARLFNRVTGGVFVCAGVLMSTTRKLA